MKKLTAFFGITMLAVYPLSVELAEFLALASFVCACAIPLENLFCRDGEATDEPTA